MSLLRRPCIGLVLAVVATRAFDCRAASVVGDNFPSNDEHRTCILHPILHQFTLVCHSISSRFIVLALHLGPDTQTIDEFFHLILFTIRFVKRKWHVQMHCPVYKQSCQKWWRQALLLNFPKGHSFSLSAIQVYNTSYGTCNFQRHYAIVIANNLPNLTCKWENPNRFCTTGRGKESREVAGKCHTAVRLSFRSAPTPSPT